MIKNPVQLRLAKLPTWQLHLLMACLCERMYLNFVFYCEQEQHDGQINGSKSYKKILDLIWESLLVKDAKINFDLQLEKLEEIIPIVTDNSPYLIYPAIDACQALSELLHSYLTGDTAEHAALVSSISATTVAEFAMTKINEHLPVEEQEKLTEVIDEFDLQWEILRILREESDYNPELIKGLRSDIRESKISNIGAFLSS